MSRNRNVVNLKITEAGKQFIRGVCAARGNSLLSGKNRKPLPFSEPPVPETKIWQCNIKDPNSNDPNKKINNSSELAEAIIFWFEKYAAESEYNLDANILAAQAYVESGFVMWAYNENISTASGISQFIMATIYDVIVLNQRRRKSERDQEDIDKITKGLRNPLNENSYKVGGNENADARYNRPILHQNVIDNPDVMIRAQFKYMKFISDRCAGLASTSLFAYNRGTSFVAKTYTEAIENAKRRGNEYEKEGVNYVLKTFIVLGDRTNKLNVKFGGRLMRVKPNPQGNNLFYFGYDNLFSENDVYKPNPNFEPFIANVAESQDTAFNISEFESDSVTQDLSRQRDIPYRFIFFPEKDFNRDPVIRNKTQIVLHHTVSGDNVAGDVGWWQTKGEKIATAFIVSRAGFIYQLFMTNYWAFHIGVSHPNNRFLQQNSIGIELSSWGGLLQHTDGQWYPARTDGDTQKQVPNIRAGAIPESNIIRYSDDYASVGGYHGFVAFERYTQAQINATKLIIETVAKKHTNIDLEYKGQNMWGIIENNRWVADPRALDRESGVWSHTSFRPDKSDAHPQPELIQMLQNLSRPMA